MAKPSDIHPIGAELYFLPVETRLPLKFGPETLTSVSFARARLRVADAQGNEAEGWGETPLSIQWVWPSSLGYQERHDALRAFCEVLTEGWASFHSAGHPLEIGHEFIEHRLPGLCDMCNADRAEHEPMPWLAALVCCSVFDQALHDAYGNLLGKPTYDTYNAEYMNQDLSAYLTPAEGSHVSFAGKYPEDYLVSPYPEQIPAWHLVGGKDLLAKNELTGHEPKDGHPVLLPDWIEQDGLFCLKVKLRGDDSAWDYDRLVKVGQIAREHDVLWLTADFNCTVTDPTYVTDILDQLLVEHPRLWQMILYIEQPFPYDLEENRIDVHSVSARKPLFMDESAHDWRLVKLGRTLGWTGVALKTCKTQTGALLTLCWAKAHGMTLMVQDLTNAMLSQIPHVLLAAHAGTIMGVETNSMQFYPDVSGPEAAAHPGLYRRRHGKVDLSTLRGPGFGYRLEEIHRTLPSPVKKAGKV